MLIQANGLGYMVHITTVSYSWTVRRVLTRPTTIHERRYSSYKRGQGSFKNGCNKTYEYNTIWLIIVLVLNIRPSIQIQYLTSICFDCVVVPIGYPRRARPTFRVFVITLCETEFWQDAITKTKMWRSRLRYRFRKDAKPPYYVEITTYYVVISTYAMS